MLNFTVFVYNKKSVHFRDLFLKALLKVLVSPMLDVAEIRCQIQEQGCGILGIHIGLLQVRQVGPPSAMVAISHHEWIYKHQTAHEDTKKTGDTLSHLHILGITHLQM